jgi:very-short-patch-repair endonuclease
MNLTSRAQQLRRDSTDAEQRLWSVLRDRQLGGYQFRRQTPIRGYIVDFVCKQRRLVVELDGSQHQQRADYDRERTEVLESLGYRVLRFWNNDVLDDLESVVDALLLELRRGRPSP